MRLLKASSLLVFLLGCEASAKEEVNSFSYYKDTRTNLCFVVSGINNGHMVTYHVYSNVPCTPEVEKLIK